MPTYRNDTDKRITFSDKNYLEWSPGQTRALEYFVPHEELGLTMTSEEPYVLREKPRGFGYKTLAVEPGKKNIYPVPYSNTVEISVLSPEGEAVMTIGDSLIPIPVGPKQYHVSRYPWDMVGYLTFEADRRINIHIKVEPFTGRGQ